MKKTLAIALCVALVFMAGGAFAQACCAGAKDAKSCPAAKDAKACGNMKATMTGKVEVKTEKVDGKDAKVAYLTLSECKADGGKACCDQAKGKIVKVVGTKAADVEKLDGKQVELKGTCKAGKEIDVAMVREVK